SRRHEDVLELSGIEGRELPEGRTLFLQLRQLRLSQDRKTREDRAIANRVGRDSFEAFPERRGSSHRLLEKRGKSREEEGLALGRIARLEVIVMIHRRCRGRRW